MNKKKVEKINEGKEKELITLEEKIEIVKKVFKYCEDNYGLRKYTVELINEYSKSSYYPSIYKHIDSEIAETINWVERFDISLKIKKYNNFYAHNHLISKLELSEKDSHMTNLIYTCLHEIGHSIVDSIIFKYKPTKEELDNFKKYDRNMYNKKDLINFADMEDNVRRAIYKYNHNETLADCFAYSILPKILKEFNIETKYFDITKSKGKKKFNLNKLRLKIKNIVLKENPSIIVNNIKINLDKDNIINKFTKQYLDNILISDDDYYTACKILEFITRYGYSILTNKYIEDRAEAQAIRSYLIYIRNLDDMIAPKYKKYIEKDWFKIGAINIAFIEFPRVWRKLQEEEGLI